MGCPYCWSRWRTHLPIVPTSLRPYVPFVPFASGMGHSAYRRALLFPRGSVPGLAPGVASACFSPSWITSPGMRSGRCKARQRQRTPFPTRAQRSSSGSESRHGYLKGRAAQCPWPANRNHGAVLHQLVYGDMHGPRPENPGFLIVDQKYRWKYRRPADRGNECITAAQDARRKARAAVHSLQGRAARLFQQV